MTDDDLNTDTSAFRGLELLRHVRTIGVIEAFSTLFLFGVAMPLKYWAGYPMVVTIVGTLHGGLFIAFVAVLAFSIRRVPMPTRLALTGMIAAVVPFGPFFVDRRFARLADRLRGA